MSKHLLIATCLTVLAASAAHAGPLPFPVAKDGTTNIADCAKAPAAYRNECISRSRPLTGKQIYAANPRADKPAPVAAVKAAAKAAVAKTTTIVKKAAAVVVPPKGPRGYTIARNGTTSIYECAKARADVRDDCIRRSRPLTGKQLAKFEAQAAKSVKPAAVAAAPKAAPKAAVAAKAPVAPASPTKVAKTPGKGFVVAKDGTTDINDCAKANAEYRNECISRARPVKGAEIYKSAKPKS